MGCSVALPCRVSLVDLWSGLQDELHLSDLCVARMTLSFFCCFFLFCFLELVEGSLACLMCARTPKELVWLIWMVNLDGVMEPT